MLYGRRDPDYSVAIALGENIDYCLEHSFGSELNEAAKNEIVSIIVKQLPLLTPDGELFNEGLKAAFNKTGISGIDLHDLTAFADELTKLYATRGIERIAEIDKKLLGDSPAIEGLEFKPGKDVPANERTQKGVLITTSNGGGCHKNIAREITARLQESGIDCAVLNESIMTQVDPLSKFIGIPFSDLYPVVFQQCGNATCRELLMEINKELNNRFIPQLRFAQLRAAANECNQKMDVNTVYSTQHYATDLLAVPKGANMLFQVCDYGAIQQLNELSSLAGAIPHNDRLKFLVPSESCLPHNLSPGDDASKVYVETVYPTQVLSVSQAQAAFKEFCHENQLADPHNKDVTRCSLVMGGQGCGDIIKAYVDRIIKDATANPDTQLEFVIACGRNEALRAELQQRYNEDNVPKNLNLNFLGFIDNKKLIAYNKNAILLTKPGGGTVSECVQNKVQTLVHYDPHHHWEAGNRDEILLKNLGAVVQADEPLLEQIQTAQIAMKKRHEQQAVKQTQFRAEITSLETTLGTMLEQQQNKRSFDKDHRAITHLLTLIELVKPLKEAYLDDSKTLDSLDALKRCLQESPISDLKEGMSKRVESITEKEHRPDRVENIISRKARAGG